MSFTLPAQDFVACVLLGSQPAFGATLSYVKKFMRLAKEVEQRAPLHLFIFCGHHQLGERSLLSQVSDLIVRLKDYPSQLTIIPLSFQTDQLIAPLFHRSDLTCTRSGGQTAMELMCLMRGEMWIHSEAKVNDDQNFAQLLKGIPGWEAGNAIYLKKLWGAKIVTPETFMSHGRRLLKGSIN
jgi:hypothetical protein